MRSGEQHFNNNGSSPHSHTNGSVKSSETNGYHPASNGYANDDAPQTVQNTSPYFGHDREEVTRIVMQGLSDLGYDEIASQLQRTSGYRLEVPRVASFRRAVLQGDWEEAEVTLFGADAEEKQSGSTLDGGEQQMEQDGTKVSGLPLVEEADTHSMRFLLREQKYLELLEQRNIDAALKVLQNELTPLKRDVTRLHMLSSLLMCNSAADIRSRALWSGAKGNSRAELLSALNQNISPSVMIPEHRLASLLTERQTAQILDCRYHNTLTPPSLFSEHSCPASDFPTQTQTELRDHTDEVWHLDFSPDGTRLATAGKDGLVVVYDTVNWQTTHEYKISADSNASATPQNATGNGICYIAFSPDSKCLCICSQSNEFVVLGMVDGRPLARGDHFGYPVTSCAWMPDAERLIIGTQDSQRPLGMYSITNSTIPGVYERDDRPSYARPSEIRNRELHSFRIPPWNPGRRDQPSSFRTTDCAVNPAGTLLAASTTDNDIVLYELETDEKRRVGVWTMEDRLSSVAFSSDGEELLINMNEGQVLTLDIRTGGVLQRFEGITQKEFVIRSTYGGAGGNLVASGSEGKSIFSRLEGYDACEKAQVRRFLRPLNLPELTIDRFGTGSQICIWRRQTGALVAKLEAHSGGTVNAVAWHPTRHDIWASAGDDRGVRIWTSATALRLANEARQASDSGGHLSPVYINLNDDIDTNDDNNDNEGNGDAVTRSVRPEAMGLGRESSSARGFGGLGARLS